MKKRFLAVALTLALCMGLAVPAFAAEAKSVTEANVTLSDVVITDEYEVFPEDFGFPEGYYHMGFIGFVEEEAGITFGTYLIPADATITLDLTEAKTAVVSCYALEETDNSAASTHYSAVQTGKIEIDLTDSEDDTVILTKAGVEEQAGAAFDLLICRVGTSEEDINSGVYVMFDAAEETPDVTPDVTDEPAAPVFTDVADHEYYAAPVAWAVENKITNGTTETTFEPETTCTQLQILTFLYRASRGEDHTAAATDMRDAVEWAQEKGIIDDTFDGDTLCTRATTVSYIWQAFDKPEAEASSFVDVEADADYAAAVSWAVEIGVTNGTNMEAGEFSPDETCTRAQIVTFLHRAYVEEARLTAPAE